MSFKNIFFSVLFLCTSFIVQATEVGAPIQVTSGANIQTRNQTWASVAWAKDSKCWLVVWREGYVNEQQSDLWCARIGKDGKTLDADGIRLTSSIGLKDQPRVASDGKDFFITWEDFKNQKDWDVYGARVSGQGEVLDKEGVLIAGGADNQCRPVVAFSKGLYSVLWMAYADKKYGIYGSTFSPSSSSVSKKMDIGVFTVKKRAKVKQGLLPTMSANPQGELLSAYFLTTGYGGTKYLARQSIDPATGGPLGSVSAVPASLREKKYPGAWGWYRERISNIAMGTNGAMLVSSGRARLKSKLDFSLYQLSKTGEEAGFQELGSTMTSDNKIKTHRPRPSVAFNGKDYLVIGDCPSLLPGDKKKRDPIYRSKLIGWKSTQDGKLEDANGFLVAGDKNFDCVLPALSSGPEGVCLVVYSEIRGVDDVKVIAQVIK